MIVEPRRPRPLAILFPAVAGERNKSHPGDSIARAQVSGNIITVSLRQSDVEEHDLGSQVFDRLKSSIKRCRRLPLRGRHS